MKDYYVYMLASGKHGTLYIGVTNDLARRIYEHKTGAAPGFTEKYDVKSLVWYEVHQSIEVAIQRKKAPKRWHRQWKIDLIEKTNPGWLDLCDSLG